MAEQAGAGWRGCLARGLAWIPVAALTLWSVLAILLAGGSGQPGPVRIVLALVYVAGCAFAIRRWKGWRAIGAVLAGIALVAVWFATISASHDRDWPEEQSRLPWAEIDGPVVTLHDVRDFYYRTPDDRDAGWYDVVLDTREIEGSDFFLVHFSEFKGIGHTMVSFRFPGDRFITVSVETRREVGEVYGPLMGLFKQYELMYVIGDERDVVQLRTNHRKSDVYRYPSKASKEQLATYFLDICRRINELREKPAFYDTVTSNCTTNLIRHWEVAFGRTFPYDYRVLLPGYVDEIGVELGLIDAGHDIEDTRRLHYVSDLGRAVEEGKDFSLAIRR